VPGRTPTIGVCVGRFRIAHHLASIVDTLRNTLVTAQGAEVRDGVLLRLRWLLFLRGWPDREYQRSE